MRYEKRSIQSVCLLVKAGNPRAVKEAKAVSAWLAKRRINCQTVFLEMDKTLENTPLADLALAFGGDGTIVSTARQLLGKGIPLAGVNFGRVGFLAELSAETWEQGLLKVLEHGLVVEKRMTLSYRVSRDDKKILQGQVINDIVVTRGKLARLVELELCVNQVPFSTLRSDGIILSTPTGSTGYAGSAGGPVVMPCINAYVVAAICPFLGSFPPLMLGEDTVCAIKVGSSGTDLFLSIDGQEAYELFPNDVLEVHGGSDAFLLASMGMNSYFKRLQDVGIIQQPCKST